MSEMDNNRFDLQMKSVMENAEEAVPEHLWADIERRLDLMGAPERKGVFVPVWFKWAGAAVAAAAALLLGVFLFHSSPVSDNAAEPLLAEGETVPEQILNRPTGRERVQDDGATSHSEFSSESAEGQTLKRVQGDSEAEQRDGNAGVESIEEQVEKIGEKYVAEGPKILNRVQDDAGAGQDDEGQEVNRHSQSAERCLESTDEWSFGEEDTKRRRRVTASLTMSGNAGSNVKTGTVTPPNALSDMTFYRPMMTSGTRKPPYIIERGESAYAMPLSFGVGTKIIFTPRWALGVGVNYTLLSRSFEGTYRPDANASSINYAKIRNLQHYIGIPLNAYFSIISNKKIDFYVYAGGTAEKCVANEFHMENPENLYKKPVKGFQFSANAGMGVEFIVADKLGIYIDPSVRYYFDTDQPKSIRTKQPLSVGAEIGLRVRL